MERRIKKKRECEEKGIRFEDSMLDGATTEPELEPEQITVAT